MTTGRSRMPAWSSSSSSARRTRTSAAMAGCLGLAVLDVELLALPFAGSSLPLPVTLGLGRLADHLRLGPLEVPGLPLASTFAPRTLLLYLRPQPCLFGMPTPSHSHARNLKRASKTNCD